MRYADVGSTIRNADCSCKRGYHFEGNDQRACVPNRECDKGYGQGLYGQCEKCIVKNMYSDKRDTLQPCRPLTNCEKQKRCTLKKSNGTHDNRCSSYVVKDTSTCGEAAPPDPLTGNNDGSNVPIIASCAAVGVIVLFVLLLFLILFVLWRRKRAKMASDPLTKEQFDTLLDRIVTRAEGDEPYSRKVIAASFREIEDRIDKQIWALAQELFREHMQPAMYEVIVEKYKERDHKYAVNGYLQDWREWKGENSESIRHLFTCLHQIGREDIMYEICNKFRESYPEVVMDAESKLITPVNQKQENITFCHYVNATLCPCANKKSKTYMKEKEENNETKDSLLLSDAKAKEAGFDNDDNDNSNNFGGDIKTIPEGDGMKTIPEESHEMSPSEAGAIYRERPCPSAPVIDDCGNVHVVIPMPRTMSVPVQASS
ncbi:hypothetical protein FSP39_023184 [Pinctada imbricata]|uniref:TNFR-Cys domain-containing protein n=1 Tax=Pinctada imbricata TaxID=66713 RepID=A0AA88YPD4_PINIB|nr:hypothetical protein FSP39_023184 [Pinctada imbricata]